MRVHDLLLLFQTIVCQFLVNDTGEWWVEEKIDKV